MNCLPIKRLLSVIVLCLWMVACQRPDPQQVTAVPTAFIPPNLLPTPLVTPKNGISQPSVTLAATFTPESIFQTATATNEVSTVLATYDGTPTPDPPHGPLTTNNQPTLTHVVSVGETLGYIAQLYGTTAEELQTTNHLTPNDFLYAGQTLQVPGLASAVGPSFKIIPDSELVYGPAAKGFKVREFASRFNGYLMAYSEEVEGNMMDGPEIVQLVADRYSVNPRLLLAVLEYRAGWLTTAVVNDTVFPMGYVQPGWDGLYSQLGWAANELNRGYYGRSEGGLTSIALGDGSRFAFSPIINDGTAGVQTLLAANNTANAASWQADSSPTGLFATYTRLFGSPFGYTIDPLWADHVEQPQLQLPWNKGETWYFTGGPHGGWASGSAWAALDFVPGGDELGCVVSDAWVNSMSAGVVSRSSNGAVVVDLDGDGFAGTGWAITYMHLETRDRIPLGTLVQVGDHLGHPSCEGGYSNGTHTHITRTLNGRWVAADGAIPFNLGGWLSQGAGSEYNGYLIRGGITKEACECRDEINAISWE